MKSVLNRSDKNTSDKTIRFDNNQKRINRLLVIINFLVFTIPVFIIYNLSLDYLDIYPYSLKSDPTPIFWIACIFALILAKKKIYLPAKLFIIFSPLIFMTFYSLTGDIVGEHFLWQPIMLLGVSIIPFLVLDVKNERSWLIIVVSFFLLYVIFHDQIMLLRAKDSLVSIFENLNTTPFVYNSVRIIIFLFLAVIIFYSVNLNDQQQMINEMINQSLVKAQNKLEVANAELTAQRNAINKSASLIITDELKNIIIANENFLHLSGYSLHELQELRVDSLISESHNEIFNQKLVPTIGEGNVWRGELQNIKKNGDYFCMKTAVSPINYQDIKQKRYLAIMFDITKIKTDEKRLEKLNTEKDRILYAVAHDLKNPLLNFKALLDLIKLGLVKQDEQEEVFRLMTRDCDHSTNLISELLELGRLEDDNYELQKNEIHLKRFLEKTLDQFKKNCIKKNITLIKSFDSKLKKVKINEQEFVRVVNNLISNAIKFTPAGGEIKVVSKYANDGKALIEISDTGIGISEELLPIIFDKFSKARRKGIEGEKSTGLGMWIVKHIIKLHDGKIIVKSKENEGTTFSILLPD